MVHEVNTFFRASMGGSKVGLLAFDHVCSLVATPVVFNTLPTDIWTIETLDIQISNSQMTHLYEMQTNIEYLSLIWELDINSRVPC